MAGVCACKGVVNVLYIKYLLYLRYARRFGFSGRKFARCTQGFQEFQRYGNCRMWEK